jgi:hypothetical protein
MRPIKRKRSTGTPCGDIGKAGQQATRRSGRGAQSELRQLGAVLDDCGDGGPVAGQGPFKWRRRQCQHWLLKRIADLEATVVVGGGAFMRYSEQGILEEAAKTREEVRKLRERNATLEKGLVAAKQAALTLAAHGNNVGVVLNKAMES